MAAISEAGPDRKETGLVRWRRVDLKAVIEDRFGVVVVDRDHVPVDALLEHHGPAAGADVLAD